MTPEDTCAGGGVVELERNVETVRCLKWVCWIFYGTEKPLGDKMGVLAF